MKVIVIYLASFSTLTGKKEEQVVLKEGETLSHLADRLAETYGEEFGNLVGKQETHQRAAMFFREGTRLKENTVLEDGDKIIISLPVGGG